jgi:hypothetical protein
VTENFRIQSRWSADSDQETRWSRWQILGVCDRNLKFVFVQPEGHFAQIKNRAHGRTPAGPRPNSFLCEIVDRDWQCRPGASSYPSCPTAAGPSNRQGVFTLGTSIHNGTLNAYSNWAASGLWRRDGPHHDLGADVGERRLDRDHHDRGA